MSKSGENKRYPLLCEEFENEKKKEQNFLTFRSGDLNPGFLNKFPPKIWILREIRFIEPGVLRTSGLYLTIFFRCPRHSMISKTTSWKTRPQTDYFWDLLEMTNRIHTGKKPRATSCEQSVYYRVFQLDMPQIKCLLGHQKCTFKS